MTPQELKNSILQWAVQGKLVEQRAEEGTAKALIEQIKMEKEQLIKDKKIKKEKTLPEITEEEIPFDIPESWEWIRLGDISRVITDGAHKTPEYMETGIPFLSVKDISSGTMDLSNTKFISVQEHNKLIQRCKPEINDILICRIGTLGKAIKIDIDLEFSIFVSLGLIKLINCEIAEYIVSVINSGYGFKWIAKNKVGGGTHTNKINLIDLKQMLLPIPPLQEQKRIVAKIGELMPYVEQYDKAYTKLEVFNKKFPEDMQKSILQCAIQGELVEQRTEEGTAEELYQQIQEEKARLIKEGQIKKEKPLPEITEDEIPFDIPESWKWVRLGNIFQTSSGTTPSKANQKYYEDGKINWIRTTDLNNSILRSAEIKISELAFEECRLQIIPYNSVCIALYGGRGTIGKNALIQFDTTINQSVCAIHPNGFCDMSYVLYFMQFQRARWMDYANGTRKDPNINQIIVKNSLFPLPPLEEQKRIVAKIEEMLLYCQQLIK